MSIGTRIARLVLRHLVPRVTRRPPDVVIGGDASPYLLRWWVLPRNRFFNVYLHEFWRSDDDRALHDHPWLLFASFIVLGAYDEHCIRAGGVETRTRYAAGSFRVRTGWHAHRVELAYGEPVVTLFCTFWTVRQWGFHCPRGWVHWRKFTNPEDGGKTIGAGCDQ